jgi:hypothetical protein
MNEEALSKVFSFTVTVVIIIGFALAVNTFIVEELRETRNALTSKEDSLKVKKISLFHQGEIFYCKNRSLRHKINNQDWVFENDKFVNKDGYFYYSPECKIENVD